jgi:hypothetical protein
MFALSVVDHGFKPGRVKPKTYPIFFALKNAYPNMCMVILA